MITWSAHLPWLGQQQRAVSQSVILAPTCPSALHRPRYSQQEEVICTSKCIHRGCRVECALRPTRTRARSGLPSAFKPASRPTCLPMSSPSVGRSSEKRKAGPERIDATPLAKRPCLGSCNCSISRSHSPPCLSFSLKTPAEFSSCLKGDAHLYIMGTKCCNQRHLPWPFSDSSTQFNEPDELEPVRGRQVEDFSEHSSDQHPSDELLRPLSGLAVHGGSSNKHAILEPPLHKHFALDSFAWRHAVGGSSVKRARVPLPESAPLQALSSCDPLTRESTLPTVLVCESLDDEVSPSRSASPGQSSVYEASVRDATVHHHPAAHEAVVHDACATDESATPRLAACLHLPWKKDRHDDQDRRLNSRVPGDPSLQTEFVGGHATDQARSRYFSSLTVSQSLKLVKLCAKQKPHILVDFLVSISKQYPTLPMFNTLNLAIQSDVQATTTELKARPPAIPAVTSKKVKVGIEINAASVARLQPVKQTSKGRTRSPVRQDAKRRFKADQWRRRDNPHILPAEAEAQTVSSAGANLGPKTGGLVPLTGAQHRAVESVLALKGAVTSFVSDNNPTEDESAVLRSWPKFGHGAYASLGPEMADMACLVESENTRSFCHFPIDLSLRQHLAAHRIRT